MTLRQHMKALHPRVRLARSNADLIKQHCKEHHQFATSHTHGGTKHGGGPNDRPAGWKTGEDVVMNPPVRSFR